MADDEQDTPKGKERRKFGALLEGAVIVALLTRAGSVGTTLLSENDKMCQIAADFFNDEKDVSIYTPDEWTEVKGIYLSMLKKNCDHD